MPLYTNHTRSTVVVTLKVNSANDLKTAIKIGIGKAMAPHAIALGYNDLPVPAGTSLELAEGADAIFIGARTAD